MGEVGGVGGESEESASAGATPGASGGAGPSCGVGPCGVHRLSGSGILGNGEGGAVTAVLLGNGLWSRFGTPAKGVEGAAVWKGL